jgi:zinc/manganese transport system permease protein
MPVFAALDYLLLPWLLCLLLTFMHAYLGLHVLRRGVIFVDLALAQLAALGTVVGLLLGVPSGSAWSYGFALGFTLLGALVLARVPQLSARVPVEASIGVLFAMAAAGSALLLAIADDAHDAHTLQATLAGHSMVWVMPAQIGTTALLYAAVALVHIVLRRPFAAISRDASSARTAGVRVGILDFVFYATFALVITSSVQLAGVLVVFAFLIVPAVIGAVLAERDGTRLLLGWLAGALASLLGLLASYRLPSGPAVVLALGALLVLVLAGKHVASARAPLRALLHIGASIAALGAVGAAIAWLPWRHWAVPARAAQHEDAVRSPAPSGPDFEASLHAAEQALARGDQSVFAGLVDMATSDSVPPFFRAQALALLRRFAHADVEQVDDDKGRAALRAWWQARPGINR